MKKYICNPMNLPYKYQFIDTFGTKSVSREAADPSLVLFKDTYYLFPSMSGGFWYSDDLYDWKYHETPELPVHDYAPDVKQIGEYLYFCASANQKNCSFFRTKDPLNSPFEEIQGSFPFWDPDMFQDDDGKVYHFWGSSNKNPLYGVELDPQTMTPIGEPVALLQADSSHGFERKGEDHILTNVRSELELKMLEILGSAPYIEGAWVNKNNGKYYLQYAAPGAQYNVYADGVYVADKPLGPYTYAKNNPFSYKPGGFLPGAGHGSTMQDKDGNWWHVSTMRISLSHRFERRIGLFPADFDRDGELFCNQRYGDWVFEMPNGKKRNIWKDPEWYLLSYKKAVKSSSCAENMPAENAADENVRTWWKAASNRAGEWLEIDLGSVMQVNAVQINFADDYLQVEFPEVELKGDEYMKRYIEQRPLKTRWLLEGSQDGKTYFTICDKRKVDTDLPHDLVINEEGVQARYIRLTVEEIPYRQPATVSGLRVFGKGNDELPAQSEVTDFRFDSLIDLTLSWKKAEGAVGYNVLWGYAEDKLYHSYMVFGKTEQFLGGINADEEIYARIDTFNENGITHGKTVKIR